MKQKIKHIFTYIAQRKVFTLSLLLVILLGIFVALGGGDWFSGTFLSQTISTWYARLVGNTCVVVLHSLGYDSAIYSANSGVLSVYGGEEFSILSRLGFRYFLLSAVILFIFPKNYKKSAFLLLLSMIAFFVLSVIQFSIVTVNSGYDKLNIAYEVLYSFKYIVILELLVFKLKIHPRLKTYSLKIYRLIRQKFHFSILLLVIMLLLAKPFLLLVDVYLFSEGNIHLQGFIQLILVLSKNIGGLLGYDFQIWDNYLYIGRYWVFLGESCLGIGIMLAFVFIILLIRSKWLNKFVYISVGLLVMILMNAARISFLLLHLYNNKGRYTIDMEVHDLSNHFFYIIVFVMAVAYILWFQYLVLIKKMNRNVKN